VPSLCVEIPVARFLRLRRPSAVTLPLARCEVLGDLRCLARDRASLGVPYRTLPVSSSPKNPGRRILRIFSSGGGAFRGQISATEEYLTLLWSRSLAGLQDPFGAPYAFLQNPDLRPPGLPSRLAERVELYAVPASLGTPEWRNLALGRMD
jgi:hypothetical protein